MSSLYDKASNSIAVLPAIILMTFANVFIATTIAGVAFIQFVSIAGWSPQLSLIVAIFISIVIHLYIFLQPQIRNYIKSKELNS